MRSKYHSRKVTINGITFDSGREARRYRELELLQRAGQISDLRLQVPFELIPAQYAPSEQLITRGPHKGEPKRGRCIERACTYIADFVYIEGGKLIAEDAKGMRTKEYIIKRKLFRYLYKDYIFREV